MTTRKGGQPTRAQRARSVALVVRQYGAQMERLKGLVESGRMDPAVLDGPGAPVDAASIEDLFKRPPAEVFAAAWHNYVCLLRGYDDAGKPVRNAQALLRTLEIFIERSVGLPIARHETRKRTELTVTVRREPESRRVLNAAVVHEIDGEVTQ